MDTYAAFCLDEAIGEFGESLEAAIEEAIQDPKTKRQNKAAQGKAKLVLMKWLSDDGPHVQGVAPKQFAAPTATKKAR